MHHLNEVVILGSSSKGSFLTMVEATTCDLKDIPLTFMYVAVPSCSSRANEINMVYRTWGGRFLAVASTTLYSIPLSTILVTYTGPT